MNPEYELIEFSLDVYPEMEDTPIFASEDSPLQSTDEVVIEYDANGIPMGDSREEIEIRETMIVDFLYEWGIKNPERKVLNDVLEDYIYVKGISVIEAKEHSAKRYSSTLAVFLLDEVLKLAKPVRRVPTKVNTNNQKQFAYMLIMVHRHPSIGTIKLTVGVRTTEQRIQYGITALVPGQPLIDDSKNDRNKTKKRKPRK